MILRYGAAFTVVVGVTLIAVVAYSIGIVEPTLLHSLHQIVGIHLQRIYPTALVVVRRCGTFQHFCMTADDRGNANHSRHHQRLQDEEFSE